MTVLHPLPGHPDSVRVLATACADTAQRLSRLAWVVARLRDGAVWEGAAGAAFGERLAQAPPALDAVAARFGGAAPALRALAAAMEGAQSVIGPAVRDHDGARHAYAVLEQRVYALVTSGLGEVDPEVARLRAFQIQQAELMAAAEARHRSASATFHEADARCAATLSALAQDAVADPAVHRFVSAASRVGEQVGMLALAAPVAPELLPVALVADVTALSADATLLLAYGEGDVRQLGVDAALTSLGVAGAALRRGGAAGAALTPSGARATAALSGRERLLVGGAAEVRARVEKVRRAFAVPPPRGTPSHLLGGPPVKASGVNPPLAAAQRLRAAALARADTAFRDQLRLAMAGGGGAKAMYVGGVTLQGGAHAVRSIPREEEPPARPKESW